MDPNNSWEIKCWILVVEAWPKQRCHWWMMDLGIVAADTSHWERCKDASLNNWPTLWLRICPICES